LFPEQGITKRELMIYYAGVARWMLPHVIDRPLMLVRCPEGEGGSCFHQKHPSRGMPRAVEQVLVPQKKGPEANLVIRDVEGLIGLVQMGALEIHTWGSRADRVECPDQLVFDLDPDEGLPWERVVEAAHTLRARLDERGLTGFLRLTGGKGLHIVVPVEPALRWDEAKDFSASLARAMVAAEPSRYVATMTKQKRRGKLFIDYFRNGRGATAVASFSTRALPNAPIALPIAWSEIERSAVRPEPVDVKSVARRLRGYRDPWAGFDDARAPIPSS
jgi:bifunctional non-homologous end joining protein LigD